MGALRRLTEDVRAVTLTELMVTLALLWVVLGSIYGLFHTGYVSYEVGEEQMDAQREGRLAISLAIKELRSVEIASDSAYALAACEPNSITFYSDVDKDEAGVEKVRYFLDGSELKKGVISPAGNPPLYHGEDETITKVASYVQNDDTPIFYYYGEDYEGVEDALEFPVTLADVKFVRILLVVDVNPGEVPEAITVESGVNLRNLKTNLGEEG